MRTDRQAAITTAGVLLDAMPDEGISRKNTVDDGYSGSVTNPPKSASQNNSVQTAKKGSSLFCNGPLNLLGGGSWRWPKAGVLDGKTLAKIRHSEVGGEVLAAPEISG
jgi:hypothetical protein